MHYDSKAQGNKEHTKIADNKPTQRIMVLTISVREHGGSQHCTTQTQENAEPTKI